LKKELIDLIKYRMEKSKETFQDARVMYEKASLGSTVNRIYYAMFYAVNGLLLSNNFSSSKHSGVRSLFNKEFEKKWGKFYSKIFEERQEGDYKDFVKFNSNTVRSWLDGAKNFINEIETVTLNIISSL